MTQQTAGPAGQPKTASEEMQRRLDNIVEEEVVRGWRIRALPEEYVSLLREMASIDPAIRPFTRVRFSKLTPRKRKLINKVVVAQYHEQIQDKKLLSKEAIRRLNIERGQWSVEKERRLQELDQQCTRMQQELHQEGFNPRERWLDELLSHTEIYRQTLAEPDEAGRVMNTPEEVAECERRFTRWLNYTPAQQADYDSVYAAEQGLPAYSDRADVVWLMDHAPSMKGAQALADIDELRDKLQRYMEYLEHIDERNRIKEQELRMYAGSVEAAQETLEELARVYYLAEVLTDDGTSAGPLASRFEDLEALPDEVIRWLIYEVYFFLNSTPDEAREYLQQWGFLPAPQPSGSPESSDGSLAEPNSKSDSAPATTTDSDSSASALATSSEISS